MVKLQENNARMSSVNEKGNHEKSHEKPHSDKAEKVDMKKLEAEADVMQTTAEIQGEVADLGIESSENAEASEGFSEGKGNRKDDSHPSQAQPTQQDLKAHIQATIPTRKMQKAVAKEIRKEIRKEERKVILAYAGVKSYPPHKLAEIVAKIRNLKDLLGSLLEATKDVLTGLYMKWVRKET